MATTSLRRRDPAQPRPRRSIGATVGRAVVIVLGVLLTLLGVLGIAAHYWSPGSVRYLGVSAFSPYLMFGALVGLVLFAAARGWFWALGALVIVLVVGATQLPLYLSTGAPVDSREVTVMTSNLRLGLADATSVIDAARRHGVQLLMLEELTPAEQARLRTVGLDRLLPYHLSDPGYGGLGPGLWSRYPLTATQVRHDFNFHFVAARAAIPGVAVAPQVVALHMCGPYPDATCWHEDIDHLPAVLRGYATAGDSTVVGGDFNATPDVTQFRALLSDGYADGADQAGAGRTRTYPSDHTHVPPLIAIDHVLTRDAVVTDETTVQIAGSDHRALVATVALPRGRSAG